MDNSNLYRLVKASIFCVVVIGIVFSQSASWAALDDTTNRPSNFVEIATGAIFSEHVSRENQVCKLSNCWTPSIAEVDALEISLVKFLTNSKDRGSSEIPRNIPQYKRKYYGYKKNGTWFILVNGLCEKFWRKESPKFESPKRSGTDMGSCYFLIDYNVEKRKFSNYYVDGEA